MAKLFRASGTNRIALTTLIAGATWTIFGYVTQTGGEICQATDAPVDLLKEGYTEVTEVITPPSTVDPTVQNYLGRVGIPVTRLRDVDTSVANRVMVISQKAFPSGDIRATINSLNNLAP